MCFGGALCVEISGCLLNVSGILWHIPTVFHRNNESIGARMNWEDFCFYSKSHAFSRTYSLLCFRLSVFVYGMLINMSLSANPFLLV